jgi:hypothetical protein
MTRNNDRPVSVLDGPAASSPAAQDRPVPAPATAAVPATRRPEPAAGRGPAAAAKGPAGTAPAGKPLPLGWGSHE